MKKLRTYIARLVGLAIVLFGILAPAFATTASATTTSTQTVFVKQASLSAQCGQNVNQWGFVITTQGLTNSEIPPYISVEWSSTKPQFVPLYLSNAPVSGGSAHYFTDTPANPDSYAFDTPINAEVQISTSWTGQFVLSHGACPSSAKPTLTIDKTAGQSPITAGGNSTFTVASSANNLLAGDQVTMTDPLPTAPGVSYSLDLASNTPSGQEVAWTSCAIVPTEEVSCTYSAPVDQSVTFANVIVDVASSPSSPTETLNNTATISADGIVETSTASISITAQTPKLTITKTAGQSPIASGSSSLFTISDLTVNGWDYQEVTLTDPLPQGSGIKYSLDAAANNQPAAGQLAWDSCGLSSDTVTCTFTPSQAGVYDPSFANVVVDVTTTGSAPSQSLDNTATIALGGITASSSASISVLGPIPATPTLSITKAASLPKITAPGSSTFTIDSSATITNIQPENILLSSPDIVGPPLNLSSVVLFDPLPAAPGVSYSLDSASNTPSGQEVAWTSCSFVLGGSIPTPGSTPIPPGTFTSPGAQAAVFCYFTPPLQVAPTTTYDFARVIVDVKADNTSPNQSIVNTAYITAGLISENSSASILIQSTTPTLSITKSSGNPGSLSSSIYAGQGSIFTISGMGVTGWDYGEVTMSDPLPQGNGVSYSLDQTSNRPTGSELPWDSCGISSDTVTCTFTPSPAGVYDPSFANVVVDVTTTDSAPSQSLDNTAEISLGDQSAYASATITISQVSYPPPPVVTPPIVTHPSVSLSDTLTKTATYPSVVAGSTDTFTITGSFTGQVNSKVVLSDPMPQYVTINGPVTDVGSGFPAGSSAACSVSSETVVCTFQPPTGGLVNPSIGTISVPVLIAANAPVGSVTNTATLTDSGDSLSSLQSSAVVSVSAPIVSSSSSAAPATPLASSSPTPTPSTIEVPAVHTGEPWASSWWWRLAIISAGTGLFLVAPRRRRRSSRAHS